MYDTLCAKFSAKNVAITILDGKKSVVKTLKNSIIKSDFENYLYSEENISRSLSVFYSHNVMGKEKYLSLRKANKNANEKTNSQ